MSVGIWILAVWKLFIHSFGNWNLEFKTLEF
jgi:hypothetical protein